MIHVTLKSKVLRGATLEEPLDSETVPQLRWWLLCHGIQAPSSEKKAAVINLYGHSIVTLVFNAFRVRNAKAEGFMVVDVDGTYLERKRQSLLFSNVHCASLPLPNFPVHGWGI